MKHDDLYFDYNGSTPVDDEVAAESVRWMTTGFGNASAAHPRGARARSAIDAARAEVACAIGAAANEIWFTSGGTESNNWALEGMANRARRGHLVVSSIEHKSVLRTAESLVSRGFDLSVAPVTAAGVVDLAALERLLRPDTFLVSVMYANNETGGIQPVREIADLCASRGIAFHTDAVCAAGKVALDMRTLGCALLSISGHKLHAPMGVGVLFVRSGVAIDPIIHGCGQQEGLRSGSENTPGAVGLGRAFARHATGAFAAAEPVDMLRDRLWHEIERRFPFARRNGAAPFLPNTLSVSFRGSAAVALQEELGKRGISVAAGAAASNGQASHVLKALGLDDATACSTLRFSLGRFSTSRSVERCLDALENVFAGPAISTATR